MSRHRINNGVPTLEAANLTRFVPDGGHLTFSPVSAPDGADALRQSRSVREQAAAHGRDYAAQFVVGLREMHHIAMFLFDTESARERQQTLDPLRRFHETVKDALDPNSILASGKSGIWGRKYR
jgi:4-cresol dehydrogenase (hydroxylating)